jgi:hypothetical protein
MRSFNDLKGIETFPKQQARQCAYQLEVYVPSEGESIEAACPLWVRSGHPGHVRVRPL